MVELLTRIMATTLVKQQGWVKARVEIEGLAAGRRRVSRLDGHDLRDSRWDDYVRLREEVRLLERIRKVVAADLQ